MPVLQQLSQQQLQLGSLHWYQQCYTAHVITSDTNCWHSATKKQHQQQQQQQQRADDKHNFSAEDLSTLALLITAAKVLFCGGAPRVALQLLQLLQPVQQAAAAAAAAAAAVQPLHLSSIRNEAAYGALICKLLTEVPPELMGRSGTCSEVLYVCGDSHILPGSRPFSLQIYKCCL
jgi:hypothetical protein